MSNIADVSNLTNVAPTEKTVKAKKSAKIRYDHLNFRLARWDERETVISFVNDNFDWALPLVNNETFFDYYYCDVTRQTLQFAIAEQDGALVAVAGYILANDSNDMPCDLWVSVWVALKGAMGAGLELMDAIPSLTGARVVACNNIRENTCPFYRFLGWTAERMPHYYRLSKRASAGECRLYRAADMPTPQLAIVQDLMLQKVTDSATLQLLGMPQTAPQQTPQKDVAYLTRRYFAYPYQEVQQYDVWQVQEDGVLLAYCVTRTVQSTFETETGIEQGTVPVLRVVDFIGAAELLPRIGGALDALMESVGAEYMDCYCVGILAEQFTVAGFIERTADSTEIVPNYLTPALIANTDYFYFTNCPDGFTMFKADGDQDRPNL